MTLPSFEEWAKEGKRTTETRRKAGGGHPKMRRFDGHWLGQGQIRVLKALANGPLTAAEASPGLTHAAAHHAVKGIFDRGLVSRRFVLRGAGGGSGGGAHLYELTDKGRKALSCDI